MSKDTAPTCIPVPWLRNRAQQEAAESEKQTFVGGAGGGGGPARRRRKGPSRALLARGLTPVIRRLRSPREGREWCVP
ncbi:hypothetical protein MKX08_004011 [Trichoderma sp. CBMAI-0020]|nr:hypothetical protein MKX08_004011 [Trichoderma sp. CBMAI-0020]